jgi:predicted DNA-binding protein (UPF0251 family)
LSKPPPAIATVALQSSSGAPTVVEASRLACGRRAGYAEAARALGVRQGTIMSRVYRGREQIAAAVG